ncbi:MAG TPA: hypothetical protein VNI01_04125, partial [Elusimicrobiota bacterium]|nr:hypothetical protein [Elusimicrobiota bacterium]
MTAARRDRVALLLAAFGAVFLANIGVLGLKAEDWQLLPAFARMLGRGLPGVAELVFSDSLRIQTGTFLVQGLLTRAFGYAPLPLFLFSFGCHLASCALVYEILTELVADADLSAAAALACLFAPTCAGALFYVTHAFFVFPVALVLGLCLLYLRPLRDPRLDLACLTLLAELAQLSGEQTVPLVYCLFGLAALRARRSRSARDRLRAAVPVAFCAATLGWLLLRVIGPNLARQAAPAELRRPLSDVALQYVSFQLDSLSPWSWMFGRFSQPVSARTWAALAAVAGCLLLFHLRAPERGQRATARGRAALRRMFPALIGASLACLAPLLFSAASGYRFGIEPKYLYAPGFC